MLYVRPLDCLGVYMCFAKGFRKIFSVFVAAALAVSCTCVGLVGCSRQDSQPGSQGTKAGATSVRIGTMPTEDILPMWVAEQEGLFSEAGLSAQILTFDSAQALSAAITAGEVDMAMVDIMRAVKLCEAGAPVVLEWVTLGTDASQGRFGVLAPADAPYSTLQELAAQAAQDPDSLAAQGVGVAANTVPEYVFDRLCEQAGLDEGAIPTQEVASLPERYSLMASGKLAGAALPGSLLELGEANGMKLLADDAMAAASATAASATAANATATNAAATSASATGASATSASATGASLNSGASSSEAVSTSANISQSVMVATQPFAQSSPETVQRVAEVWDAAAQLINSSPSSYISLLAEKANLNETIADSYPISTYPLALLPEGGLAHPLSEYVVPQIEWMRAKGYSSHDVSYSEATGELAVEL